MLMSAPVDIAELQRIEESLWRTETRFDRAYLETVFAADLVEFGKSGRIWSRAELIEVEARPLNGTLPLIDFAVRMLAPDIAQTTYVSETHDGFGLKERALRSSIWRREQGRWRLVFAQGTPALTCK